MSNIKFLKVKIKHLSQEQRIIRFEEGKHKKWRWDPNVMITDTDSNGIKHFKYGAWVQRWYTEPAIGSNRRVMSKDEVLCEETLYRDLHWHRIVHVRPEIRSSLLAYGFLRGRKYRELEDLSKLKSSPDWDNVAAIALRFSVDTRSMTVEKKAAASKVMYDMIMAWRTAHLFSNAVFTSSLLQHRSTIQVEAPKKPVLEKLFDFFRS